MCAYTNTNHAPRNQLLAVVVKDTALAIDIENGNGWTVYTTRSREDNYHPILLPHHKQGEVKPDSVFELF